MFLHQLCAVPPVTISYDSSSDWLYLDWCGDLTLPAVQRGVLALLRCYRGRCYPRVLSNHEQVTSVADDLLAWAGAMLDVGFPVLGIQQWAWVPPPLVRGRRLAEALVSQWPHLPVSLFDDLEQAVTWLQHTPPLQTPVLSPAAVQAKLLQLALACMPFRG